MRVLAFDACLGAVSAAAGEMSPDGAWTAHAQAFVACTSGHAEALMPMLARVVGEAGITFKDVDRIVTTVGPGGFTGVRVGVAAARAFAVATGCALVGITSLEALAEEARARLEARGEGRDIVVAVDARRGMVFHARFASGALAPAIPQLLSLELAAIDLLRAPGVVVGSAAPALLAGATEALRGCHLLCDLQPNAATFAALGARRAPDSTLIPLYLRPPDAKEQAASVLARARP